MKRALVIGAGRSGVASSGLLARQGWDVILSDLVQPRSFLELSETNISYVWGNQDFSLLDEVSLVIVSPGISLDTRIIVEARARHIEVIGELELFYRHCSLPILAVTGTNGKTTTTSLLGKIMEKTGKPVLVGGNIGHALSEDADHLPADGWVVLEVSSYQLETTETFKPFISGILNLTPDHLERHKTLENYQMMKEKIFKNQDKGDFLLLNHGDVTVLNMKGRSKASIVLFDPLEELTEGIWGNEKGLFSTFNGEKSDILLWSDTNLLGKHNRENIALAAGMALCAGVSPELIRETVREFTGVEHRIEWVRSLHGVDYYNDSKATNPDSTMKALEAFEKPVIWLVGGYDKGSYMGDLYQLAMKKAKWTIFFGKAGERFFQEATQEEISGIFRTDSLKGALEKAHQLGEAEDIILLSPACSSFDEFSDYEERGRLFKKWVGELI